MIVEPYGLGGLRGTTKRSCCAAEGEGGAGEGGADERSAGHWTDTTATHVVEVTSGLTLRDDWENMCSYLVQRQGGSPQYSTPTLIRSTRPSSSVMTRPCRGNSLPSAVDGRGDGGDGGGVVLAAS